MALRLRHINTRRMEDNGERSVGTPEEREEPRHLVTAATIGGGGNSGINHSFTRSKAMSLGAM
eukprot:1990974-Alexandrium_andersonii.AAC.1